MNEEHQNFANRKIDIVPVVGSIWRITASFPGYESSTGIADYIYERAQAFCGERGMGMMPQTDRAPLPAPTARPPRPGSNSAAPLLKRLTANTSRSSSTSILKTKTKRRSADRFLTTADVF
ncbi:MAG: hypothetical protein V8T46_08660 [Sutterella seckii]